MAYLNLDPDYFDHPKTKRLIGLLGKGAETLPIKLWCYCAKFHPEQAMLQAYLPEEIEAIVGWDGEKNKMVNAMLKVGFLIKKDDSYVVKDWLEHEGHIAKFKKRSKLAAKARWKKIIKPSIASSIACNETKHRNHTIPYHTIPTNIKTSDLVVTILYLNEKAKRNFDPKNDVNQRLVKARLLEGRTPEDFKKVIDKKIAKWLGDPKMRDYLRPSTLFNKTNFENYLNEPDICPKCKGTGKYISLTGYESKCPCTKGE